MKYRRKDLVLTALNWDGQEDTWYKISEVFSMCDHTTFERRKTGAIEIINRHPTRKGASYCVMGVGGWLILNEKTMRVDPWWRHHVIEGNFFEEDERFTHYFKQVGEHRYQRIPLEVEAVQWNGDNVDDVIKLMSGFEKHRSITTTDNGATTVLDIGSRGNLETDETEWLVKVGENLHHMMDAEFKAVFEPVEGKTA